MSKATSRITDKFKCSFIKVANESESVAAQKMMFKLGFKNVRYDSRDVSNAADVRFIYVNTHCLMFLYTQEAKGSSWRETSFEELSAAVSEVIKLKREESKATKKRAAQRKWDATATERTTEVCPVRGNVVVAVKLEDGEVITERADWFDWTTSRFYKTNDIASYKVLEPNKHKPKPAEGKVVGVDEMFKDIASGLGLGVAVPVEVAPDTNPKKQYGLASLPLEMWPDLASAYGALALYNGSLKYGKANFANTPVEASIYIAAARRHLASWCAGEEFDPADGVPHLGGVLANIAILICARAAGTLIDDRMLLDGFLKERDVLKAMIPRVNEVHAGKNPKHYTRDQV